MQHILGASISDKFIAQIFEGYPEASTGGLVCTGYNYRKRYYDFAVLDAKGRVHERRVLNFPQMVRGLRLFMEAKGRGELRNIHWQREGRGFEYDATTVDAITQFALFGRIKD